ncbi:hypothetical protein M1D51_11675 [Arthrobacter sp. R3-55]
MDPLARSFSRYDEDELWTLLFAAASSPSVRHRSASVGSALAAALRTRSIGPISQPSPLPAIQELVDNAALASGIDYMQEDFIPKDPSEFTVVRVGDSVKHSVPGATERPIADLSRALRLAEVLDIFLVKKHGFGLSNVIRVAYDWADVATRALLSSFVSAPNLQLGDRVDVPTGEVQAAGGLTSREPLMTEELTEADAAALEWMTASSDNAKFDASSPTSPFGWHLRYRTAGLPDRWLPPTYVSEIVGAAVSELVSTVDRNPDARSAIRISSLGATRKALWRFTRSLYGTADVEGTVPLTGDDIHWVLPVNANTAVAVSIVQTQDLLPQSQTFGSERLAKNAAGSSGPITVKLAGGGSLTLPPNTEIVPLVVFSGPAHLAVPQRRLSARMALEDLTWIAETAEDADDLYLFCRDLSDPNFSSTFGWEVINYWEPWRSNGKSFFVGGVTPSFFYFEAHAGDAEWERAAKLSRLEQALHAVALPPLRHLQVAEVSSAGVATIAIQKKDMSYDPRRGLHHAPSLLGWSIALTNPPVAITRSDQSWSPSVHFDFLFDFSGGLVFGFDAVQEVWERAHRKSTTAGYRVELQTLKPQERTSPEDPIIRTAVVDEPQEDGARVFQWTIDVEKFIEAADGDARAANRITADAFIYLLEANALDPDELAELREVWVTGKPFLILETASSKTVLNNLHSPWKLDPADESATIAASARALRVSGVEPGTYRGKAANDLVQQHLAPLALAALTDRIRPHDHRTLVEVGLEQLNRVMDDGTRQRGDLYRVAAHLDISWDPEERMAEAMAATLMLRQCNEIIVEAALRGTAHDAPREAITNRKWSGLLAAADAYRTMTTISERLHHQVAPLCIEITHSYEIKFVDDDLPAPGSWLLDAKALDKAAAGAGLYSGPSFERHSPASFEDLDQAMLRAEGASMRDIFHVLESLVRWRSFPSDSSVAAVPEAELLDWISAEAEQGSDAQRQRYRRALTLLTCAPEKLQESAWEPWQTRTRRHRLLAQPIVQNSNGSLLIAPQYLMTSLSVYNNHLRQGLLPWTAGLPSEVAKALEGIRDKRNKQFERTLEEELQDLGFATIARVKAGDHKRLGIPTLTTEIDLIAAKPGEDTIWLIEAKDPATVHAIAETARQLRTFYVDSTNSRGKTKPCYATQLARKNAELAPFTDQVAAKLGLERLTDGSSYKLSTLFVTRRVSAVGFVGAMFPVKTLEEFLKPWLDS